MKIGRDARVVKKSIRKNGFKSEEFDDGLISYRQRATAVESQGLRAGLRSAALRYADPAFGDKKLPKPRNLKPTIANNPADPDAVDDVILTNKGSNTMPVQITQDGVALTNQFLETFVTGSDPGSTNSSPQNSPVQLQTVTATNAVTIPEYSVVRLEWTGFTVPNPTLALTVSNATQSLSWTGLTNVICSV